MARGEVRYRMVLESDFKQKAEESAKAMGALDKTFGSAVGSIESKAQGLAGSLGGLGSAMTALGPGGLAAAAGIGAIVSAATIALEVTAKWVGKLAEHADNLAALSDKTGVSTSALQKWELAAKLGNTTTDALASSMVKMQKAMADSPEQFQRLGLSVSDLKKLSPEQQFQEVTRSLLALDDASERASIGTKLMGKSFADNIGAFKALAGSATDLGGALDDETASSAADLQDQMDRLGVASERLGEQLAGILVRTPGLSEAIGEIAEAIGDVAQGISDNRDTLDYFMRWIGGLSGATGAVSTMRLIANTARGITPLGDSPAVKQRFGEPDLGPEGMSATAALRLLTQGLQQDLKKANREAAEFTRHAREAARETHKTRMNILGATLGPAGKAIGSSDAFRSAAAAIGAASDQVGALSRKLGDVNKEWAGLGQRWNEVQHEINQKMVATMRDLADSVIDLGDAFGGTLGDVLAFGAGAFHVLANINDEALRAQSTWKKVAGAIQGAAQAYGSGFGKGALAGAQAGAQFGLLGAGIGAIGGGLLGLLGGNKEHKQVNDMRDEFVKAAGGIAALDAKAHAAGKTLTAMLNAKTVKDYEAAINDLNGAMNLHDQALEETNAAMERWQVGYSKVDEMAGQLMKDQQLLVAKGFDLAMVNEKMAAGWSEYVQAAIESGESIPESLRATIDQLSSMGLLVDENGEAFDEATIKGLSFTDKLTDQMSRLIDEIHRLVNAMQGIPDVDVNVRTRNVSGGGGDRPVRFEEENSFAEGTGGFRDFGGGTPAMLHGTEAVVRPMDLERFADRIASRMGGGRTYVTLQVGSRQFGEAVAEATASGRMRPKQRLRGVH